MTTASRAHDPLLAAKHHLRKIMREKRRLLGAEERCSRSDQVAQRFLALVAGWPPGPIAAFCSLADEIDTRPLLAGLRDAGREIVLPRQAGRTQPLELRVWRPGVELVVGSFGVAEPPEDAPEGHPVGLAVPLLAFDRQGRRLGYGAGFYDRTLARVRADLLPPLSIGYALDLQEVDEVPTHQFDARLDYVVTETRLLQMAPG